MMEASAASGDNNNNESLSFEVSVNDGSSSITRDKASLLPSAGAASKKKTKRGSASSSSSFCSCLSIEYYQPYFDVDTIDIVNRIKTSSIYLFKKDTFLLINNLMEEGCDDNGTAVLVDAYGPFWISSTLIFILASCSNVASYLRNTEEHWSYDFSTVASACTAVYTFCLGFPFIVYASAVYGFNIKPSRKFNVSTLCCVYGYGLLGFIAASILCVVPWSNFIDWIVMFGFGALSCFFIMKNVLKSVDDTLPSSLNDDESENPSGTSIKLGGTIGLLQFLWTLAQIEFADESSKWRL